MKNIKKAFNVKEILIAIRHPIHGLKIAFLTEATIRWELIILIILIPLTFTISQNITHQILLISSWMFVIIMELINTTIETIVDRIGFEHNRLSAKAKDISSAAVLLAGLNAAIIWSLSIIKFIIKIIVNG